MASGQQECQFSHSTPEGMNTALPQKREFYLQHHTGLVLLSFSSHHFILGNPVAMLRCLLELQISGTELTQKALVFVKKKK